MQNIKWAMLRGLHQFGVSFWLLCFFFFPLSLGVPGLVQKAQANFSRDWGVLVLNSDADTYAPGETAEFALAVLNPQGKMVCNAKLHLKITGPWGVEEELTTENGGIQVQPECQQKRVVQRPDFIAHFAWPHSGRYQLELTADTEWGSYTISETRLVRFWPESISVVRAAPTRIYPEGVYTNRFTITSRHAVSGTFIESIPTSFSLETSGLNTATKSGRLEISWPLTLRAGESKTFEYQFKTPSESPKVFELGKARFVSQGGSEVWHQQNAWKLAIDATFTMQTGYYVGTGLDNRAITGIGFTPDLVLIKDASAGGSDGILWRSSSMGSEVTAKLGDSEVDLTTNAIQSLDSDGFTLGTNADVNAASVVFYYIAFGGSDCTSSGTFCVTSYTGNSTNDRLISTGFQPDFVSIKRSGASGGVWTSSSVAAGGNQWWISRVQDASGFINSLDTTGFRVSTTNEVNANSNTYWAFAFKVVSGAFYVGSYTGNGTSQSITAPGFKPDAIFTKNATNGTTQQALVYNTADSYGQVSLWATDAAATTLTINSLDTNGFSVGSNAAANDNTQTFQYFAFKGNTAATATGTYKMAVGSFSGNGTSQSISGVGFQPDLVIIKHVDQATDQHSVWASTAHPPAHCSYFAAGTTNITSQCITIDSDGFSVGSSLNVNGSGDTYHYQVFGNAWRPDTRTGAADFLVGAYIADGVDGRDVAGLPFQPDIVVIKRNSGTAGTFRSSATAGDLSAFFGATAETANNIQALNSDGFEIGGAANVNTASATAQYHYFMFKLGPDLKTGYYSGNAGTQSITTPNIEPNLVWVKRTTTVNGVFRGSSLGGDSTQYFANTANVTGRITSLDTTGFSVGNNTETNASGTNNYLYVAWKIPTTYTQNDFEFMVTTNSVTLTNNWPNSAGGVDLAENTAIPQLPAIYDAPGPGSRLRIQMNLTTAGSRMGSSQQGFKLQYSAATDCTVASSWTDVGAKASGSIWRLFDEASIGDSTAQVNDISTSNAGSEGYYSEINSSATNPNAVVVGNNTEWDWPVENNGAASSTTYCFRMVLSDGRALATYNSDSYPKLVTAPANTDFMRHGKYFESSTERGFFWTN